MTSRNGLDGLRVFILGTLIRACVRVLGGGGYTVIKDQLIPSNFFEGISWKRGVSRHCSGKTIPQWGVRALCANPSHNRPPFLP